MIRKLLRRVLMGCLLTFLLSVAALTCCCLLAISTPRFYAVAMAFPPYPDDARAALDQTQLAIDALQLFIATDPAQLAELKELPEGELAKVKWGQRGEAGRLPVALAELQRRTGDDPDTFAIRLKQTHIDAWLDKEWPGGSDLRDPCVALQGELLRTAFTVTSPVGDLALSCDLKPTLSEPDQLCLELHAMRIGRLPLPAKLILQQVVKLNPSLPEGFRLDLTSRRPRLLFTGMPADAKLWLDKVQIAGGELMVSLRRGPTVGG